MNNMQQIHCREINELGLRFDFYVGLCKIQAYIFTYNIFTLFPGLYFILMQIGLSVSSLRKANVKDFDERQSECT